MKLQATGFALTVLLSTLLIGCGGGGGGGGSAAQSGPVVSTLSFPLQTAQKTLAANGLTRSFAVSITAVSATTGTTVTCSGSGNTSDSPAATAATFEGSQALSAVSTITMIMSASTGCNAVTDTTTTTLYYDGNYVPLGTAIVGGDYGVYSTPPSVPASVNVNDTGIIGTENLYTNSTKATPNGSRAISFIVEPDTSTTAIVNLISKYSDAAGAATGTEQSRYRITALGALTPISSDIQFTNGNRAIIRYR